MIITLMFLAIMSLVISTVLAKIDTDHSEPHKVHVILNGTIKVEGYTVPVTNIKARAFLGIRYAQIPVSAWRFLPPRPAVMTLNGHIEAFHMMYPCPQMGRKSSEDCLHLNIWTPYSHCGKSGEKCTNLTVLFFLHGGFFQEGANSDYDGRYLSVFGHLIVVVPNYRLGIFGFLQDMGTEVPENVGLMDQLLALEWTQQNIGSFGGNPADIVLLGHEAGSKSVTYLLNKYLGGANFRRMILLSGSGYTRYPVADDKAYEFLVYVLSCSIRRGFVNITVMACLKSLPFRSLIDESLPLLFPRFELTDTESLGASHDVPNVLSGMDVLLGYMEDDGTGILSELMTLFKSLRRGYLHDFTVMLWRIGFSLKDAEVITKAYYMDMAGNARLWRQHLCADVLIVCPAHYYAEALVRRGNNVIMYYMARENAVVRQAQHRHITHLLFGGALLQAGSLEEQALIRQSIEYFTAFATGIFQGTHFKSISGAGYRIFFKKFSVASTETTIFSQRKRQCDFLRPFFQRIGTRPQ